MMKGDEKGLFLANVRLRSLWISLSVFLFVCGCATAWQSQGSFYKTTQTQLLVETKTSGKIYVNNKHIGSTPAKLLLEYNQEIERKTRKVSYWQTQPGLSLLLTVGSLGIYLPFSFIPVDIETSLEPLNSFRDNIYAVLINAEGYKKWEEKIVCKGEKTISLQPLLEKQGEDKIE